MFPFPYPSISHILLLQFNICIFTVICLHCLQLNGQQRNRYPPPPLNTLELQKKATQYLRLPGMHCYFQHTFVAFSRLVQIQCMMQTHQSISYHSICISVYFLAYLLVLRKLLQSTFASATPRTIQIVVETDVSFQLFAFNFQVKD